MKKLLATLAVLTTFVAPAFAQGYDPTSGIGAAHSEAYYTRAYGQDAANAQARALPQAFRHAPSANNVYDAQGRVTGTDPDPNVRLQMRMDDVADE